MNGTDIAAIILAIGTAFPAVIAAIVSLLNLAKLKKTEIKLDNQHLATNSRFDELIQAKVEAAMLTERLKGEKLAREIKDARRN